VGAGAATLIGGVLYGLAFPPTAARWLSWIALVPLIVVARGRTLHRAAAMGALYGLAGMCVTVDWLPRTVAVYYGQPVAVGLALFAAIGLLMVAPPVAAFAAAVRATRNLPPSLRVVVAAAAWTACEFWREHALGGNPWVLIGYSQAQVGLVAQVADMTGVFGVGFVVVLANAAIAELALALRARALPRDVLVAACGAALVVAATLAYGERMLRRSDGGGTPVPVAVAQGNLDLGSQWREDFYGRNLDAYLRLTLDALRARPTRLVVWPEAAMTFFLDTDRAYQTAIGQVLASFGAQLVAGGPQAIPGTTTTYRNAAFLIEPSGAIGGRYDKERLLPFAEYFPFPALDILRRSFGRVREFTPGERAPAPLPTVAGRAGVLICNEAMFAEVARDRVGAGAEVLLVLTNDTWVGDLQFADIAFDMAVLRAIETRRWLVRASTAGPSAVIDPTGVVRAMVPFGKAAAVAGDVTPRDDLTVYARVGDVFAVGCVAVTAMALVAAAVRRRVRRRRAA